MRTFLLTIALIALAAPALACGMNKTSAQAGPQTPLPVASSEQPPPTTTTPAQSAPQG